MNWINWWINWGRGIFKKAPAQIENTLSLIEKNLDGISRFWL